MPRQVRSFRDAGRVLGASRGRVGAYVAQWMTTTLAASDRRVSTQATCASLLRKHVVPHIGDRALDTVTVADIEALLLILELTLSPSTRRNVYAATRTVFDTAVRDRLLATHPVVAVRRPRLPHREARHLEADQLRALMAAAVDDPLAGLWLLLAGTGVRPGEALGLRWAEFGVLRPRCR